MHRRLQTNDAFEISFGQIISCRQDTDAPKVNYGQNHQRRNEMKAAPFYLVYQGVSAKN
jgi:hypothetical protein